MDAVSFPVMPDENLSSLHIWLLIQAVAIGFYKVDSNSIFSPPIHVKQPGLKAVC